MLQRYEAIYDHGQMKWLGDHPSVDAARVIVTILSDKGIPSPKAKHEPSLRIAGKCKVLGDIILPAAQLEEADGGRPVCGSGVSRE